jgi:DNA integrity scanning protein DisA with diadenylate cyclase activity
MASLSPVDGLPQPTGSPTLKATIAPIHTKEPVVKPPVDQPSVTPSITQFPNVPDVKPTPTVPKPEGTVKSQNSTNSSGNETASEFFQKGMTFQDAGNYTAAIIEYDHAIDKEPYFTDAWYHKAVSYEKLGLWDEAYQAYRFLLTIDPGYPAGLTLTGVNQTPPDSSIVPPIGPPPDQTALLWILGLAIIGSFAAGLFLARHKKRISSHDSGAAVQTRIIQNGQKPFPDLEDLAERVKPFYSGDEEVLKTVIRISIEIAREGREGKSIGTAFILGDSDAVLERSRQLILNPLAGHSDEERLITNPDMSENVKELSLVDGAFVIRDNGIVEAAGRYISIDTSNVNLPKGFGTRHVSVAAITQETEAIGVVVSESGGLVRVFAKGTVIVETM